MQLDCRSRLAGESMCSANGFIPAPPRSPVQAGSYRNRVQAAASEKRGGNDQQQQHSRASSLPQRGGVGSRMWATGLASSRLKPVLQKHRRRPVGLAVTSTVGPASAGKLLICAALLIFIRKRLKHHTSRLGCRLNGGFAEWAERHGCRESRPPPWMADGGGPTELDRSEGTPTKEGPNREQALLVTFGWSGSRLFKSNSPKAKCSAVRQSRS
jgi:hypothetical protein